MIKHQHFIEGNHLYEIKEANEQVTCSHNITLKRIDMPE